MSYFDWPPPYHLKVSARARRLQLKIDHCGLVVICPKNISREDALLFLNSNRAWVLKHLDQIQVSTSSFIWPEEICFPALDQRFGITYRWNTKRMSMRTLTNGNLQCALPRKDPYLFKQGFRRWLLRQARPWLLNKLSALSDYYGLPYKKASIRCQKTRWGSCSQNKDISLNAQLIFFPKAVVDYVIIHELCHTIYMNHSKEFWSMVEAYQPDYRQSIKQLKKPHKASMYI